MAIMLKNDQKYLKISKSDLLTFYVGTAINLFFILKSWILIQILTNADCKRKPQ